MCRRSLLVVAGLALSAVLAPGRPGLAESPAQVEVTNFPPVQAVSGRVAISEPVPQTRFETRKSLVPTTAPADIYHLTDAGSIDGSGFTYVTLSLGGDLQRTGQAGTVGVILVPDVSEVLEALRSNGVLQFPLRLETPVLPLPSGLFSSESKTFRLAFHRYRVLFYNTTPRSADTTLYALLSTS